MHPLTAESLAVSGFPGKKKRTKHRHIVSMFGPIMANHANNDTKCTPGSRRGAFYFAWGAFSGGGVHVLFEGRLEEVLFCQEQRHIRF